MSHVFDESLTDLMERAGPKGSVSNYYSIVAHFKQFTVAHSTASNMLATVVHVPGHL